MTIRVPLEDQLGSTKGEMIDDIRISLGGRIAEELILDDISTGASSDIQKATQVARNMVTRYGMSDRLGPILYGSEHTSDEVFLGTRFQQRKGLLRRDRRGDRRGSPRHCRAGVCRREEDAGRTTSTVCISWRSTC